MATAFAGDTSVVVCGFDDGWLGSWLLQSPVDPEVAGVTGAYSGDVQCVAIDTQVSPAVFSIGCTDGMVSEWELDQMARRCLTSKQSWQAHDAPHVASTPHAGVSAVSLGLPLRVASGGSDGVVCIWDRRESGDFFRTMRRVDGAHTGAATAVALADSFVISGGEDGAVRLWSPAADAVLPLHDRDRGDVQLGAVRHLALDPVHNALSSASEDGFVRLWDVGVGRATRRLSHHVSAQARFSDRGVPAVAIDAQDRSTVLVSGAADGSLCVWDLRQPKPVDQVQAHADSVSSICLKGQRLLTGSCGGASAILRDMRNFQEVEECIELRSPPPSMQSDDVAIFPQPYGEVFMKVEELPVCHASSCQTLKQNDSNGRRFDIMQRYQCWSSS